MRDFFSFIASIADNHSDTLEEQRKHTFLIYIGLFMSSGGIVWGSICAYYGLLYPALIPYGYVALTVLNFLYLYKTKDFHRSQSVQLFISLMLPFLFQLSLGGFVASGGMIMWSMLAIFGAFTYKDNKSIIGWQVLFVGLIVLSAFVDEYVIKYSHGGSQELIIIFFAFNIAFVTTICFSLLYYFADSEKKLRNSLQENLDYINKAQKNLVESEKMASLGRLVAGVAHEINTPLGVSVTATSHMQKKYEEFNNLYKENQVDQESFEKFLETNEKSIKMVLANLDRAADLVRSFKRMAVDQSTDDIIDIMLKDYLESVVFALQPKIKKTTHTIEIVCPNMLVRIAAGSLSQIITNLIENAIIHAFSNMENGKVTIQAQSIENKLQIIYTDNGKGMDEDTKSKFFDPFFTTERANGGSGLGTHLIYNLVKQSLHGEIELESEPGKGLKLIMTIPVEEMKNV